MKAVVAAFNQEKALVGAFSVITNLQMQLFEALVPKQPPRQPAQVPLGVYEGSGPEDDVEAELLRGGEEGDEVIVAGEVVVAGAGLVAGPLHVGLQGVQASHPLVKLVDTRVLQLRRHLLNEAFYTCDKHKLTYAFRFHN